MRKLLCLCTLLLVALFSFAQQKILSGTISDKDKKTVAFGIGTNIHPKYSVG